MQQSRHHTMPLTFGGEYYKKLSRKLNIAIKATNAAAFLDRKEEKEND